MRSDYAPARKHEPYLSDLFGVFLGADRFLGDQFYRLAVTLPKKGMSRSKNALLG